MSNEEADLILAAFERCIENCERRYESERPRLIQRLLDTMREIDELERMYRL